MAKWGEGDPRWVVEHREDGKNVNSWHWEENSKLSWSKNRIGELLTGLSAEIPESEGSLTIVNVKQVTGEVGAGKRTADSINKMMRCLPEQASVTVRKGNKKLILFDLQVTLEYEGRLAEGNQVKGEIKLEEFSSHSEEEDYIFTVTAVGTGQEQDKCKKIAEGMRGIMCKRLQVFVTEINEF